MAYIADCAYQASGYREGSRGTRRFHVHMPASITVAAHEEQVAFVRDISPCGMFFYSNLKPEKGAHLNLVLRYLGKGAETRLNVKGIVKRLEVGTPGTAVGVAIQFDHRHDEVPTRRSCA